MIYLTDLFKNILDYYHTQYNNRKDFFLNIKNIKDTNNIDLDKKKELCTFIDEDKLNKKILDIKNETQLIHDTQITKADKKQDKDINKILDFKQAGINQLQTFINRYKTLKLVDYIDNSNSISQEILNKIKNITGKHNDIDITINDLYNYFYTFNSNYFNINLINFMNTLYSGNPKLLQEKKNDIDKLIKKLTFNYQKEQKDNYQNLSILFDKTYQLIDFFYKKDDLTKIKLPLALSNAEADFEQSNIIHAPNIRIFCTNLDSTNIEHNLFNRFVYFHEIGHNFTTDISIINIDRQAVCINKQKTDNSCDENEKLYDYNLKNELQLKDPVLLLSIQKPEYNMINELVKDDNTFLKYLDTFSDCLAFFVIINDLKSLHKSDSEIFDYCISIFKALSGDDYHFSDDTRMLINIYLNPLMRTELERRINLIPLPVVSTRDYITEYWNFITTKLKHSIHFKSDTSNNEIDDLKEDELRDILPNLVSYGSISEDKLNEIIDTHIKFDLTLQTNYDKIKKFISDTLSYSFSPDLDDYKQKYLKYKHKYLKLKKNL